VFIVSGKWGIVCEEIVVNLELMLLLVLPLLPLQTNIDFPFIMALFELTNNNFADADFTLY
jgi:hypothetical protein